MNPIKLLDDIETNDITKKNDELSNEEFRKKVEEETREKIKVETEHKEYLDGLGKELKMTSDQRMIILKSFDTSIEADKTELEKNFLETAEKLGITKTITSTASSIIPGLGNSVSESDKDEIDDMLDERVNEFFISEGKEKKVGIWKK